MQGRGSAPSGVGDAHTRLGHGHKLFSLSSLCSHLNLSVKKNMCVLTHPHTCVPGAPPWPPGPSAGVLATTAMSACRQQPLRTWPTQTRGEGGVLSETGGSRGRPPQGAQNPQPCVHTASRGCGHRAHDEDTFSPSPSPSFPSADTEPPGLLPQGSPKAGGEVLGHRHPTSNVQHGPHLKHKPTHGPNPDSCAQTGSSASTVPSRTLDTAQSRQPDSGLGTLPHLTEGPPPSCWPSAVRGPGRCGNRLSFSMSLELPPAEQKLR